MPPKLIRKQDLKQAVKEIDKTWRRPVKKSVEIRTVVDKEKELAWSPTKDQLYPLFTEGSTKLIVYKIANALLKSSVVNTLAGGLNTAGSFVTLLFDFYDKRTTQDH